MHHPEILFLDEPTIGLDPQTREHIWDYIRTLAEKEKLTIIMTTHYMDEADLLCNDIAIIDHGIIKIRDTPEKLKSLLAGDNIIVRTKFPDQACNRTFRAGLYPANAGLRGFIEFECETGFNERSENNQYCTGSAYSSRFNRY